MVISEGRGWTKTEVEDLTEQELSDYLDDMILINDERAAEIERRARKK